MKWNDVRLLSLSGVLFVMMSHAAHAQVQPCDLPVGEGSAGTRHEQQGLPSGFDSIQIETGDVGAFERFFEILGARVVLRMDHPLVDYLRGYCYRGLQIVLRQDLKASRPAGWVQINFAVTDVATLQDQLHAALRASALAQATEEERSRIISLRLKPEVRRGQCAAARLEVTGPEGFMIGFNEYKADTCTPRGR
jgi:hypothetical protein